MDSAEFRSFVERLGKALDADVVDEKGELGLSLALDSGRHQQVFLGLVLDALDRPLLAAYAHIGDIEDIDPMAALELNATTPYGAVALLGRRIIMRRTERLSGLDPASLAESIQLLALNADLIEQTLYGRRDRY